MVQRFVVLSLARSGTSLLTSTLHTHPAILCHGEIFHPSPRWHLYGTLEHLSEEEKRALQGQPDFLDRVFDQDRPLVGFKMWRSQNPAICDGLMADDSVAKIIYERENALAQYASGQLARATGVWNVSTLPKDLREKTPALPFGPGAFAQFLAKRAETLALYRSLSRGKVLDLTYREVVTQGFDRVLDFLGQPPMALTPQKAKLHGSDILGRYAPEVRQTILAQLEKIGHPEWITE